MNGRINTAALVLNGTVAAVTLAALAAIVVAPASTVAYLISPFVAPALTILYLAIGAFVALRRRIPWAAVQWATSFVAMGAVGAVALALKNGVAVSDPAVVLPVALVILDALAFQACLRRAAAV